MSELILKTPQTWELLTYILSKYNLASVRPDEIRLCVSTSGEVGLRVNLGRDNLSYDCTKLRGLVEDWVAKTFRGEKASVAFSTTLAFADPGISIRQITDETRMQILGKISGKEVAPNKPTLWGKIVSWTPGLANLASL